MKINDIANEIKKQEILLRKANLALSKIKGKRLDVFESTDNAVDFFNLISIKNVQAKSPETENFLSKKLEFKKISSSLGKGDFINNEGNYIELKTSYTFGKMNIRQIRLYQDVDFYLCIHIDEVNVKESRCYFLTHKEMKNEVAEFS